MGSSLIGWHEHGNRLDCGMLFPTYSVQTSDRATGREVWVDITAPSADEAKRMVSMTGCVVGEVRQKEGGFRSSPPIPICQACGAPLVLRGVADHSKRTPAIFAVAFGAVIAIAGLFLIALVVGCLIAPAGVGLAIWGLMNLDASRRVWVCPRCQSH